MSAQAFLIFFFKGSFTFLTFTFEDNDCYSYISMNSADGCKLCWTMHVHVTSKNNKKRRNVVLSNCDNYWYPAGRNVVLSNFANYWYPTGRNVVLSNCANYWYPARSNVLLSNCADYWYPAGRNVALSNCANYCYPAGRNVLLSEYMVIAHNQNSDCCLFYLEKRSIIITDMHPYTVCS